MDLLGAAQAAPLTQVTDTYVLLATSPGDVHLGSLYLLDAVLTALGYQTRLVPEVGDLSVYVADDDCVGAVFTGLLRSSLDLLDEMVAHYSDFRVIVSKRQILVEIDAIRHWF